MRLPGWEGALTAEIERAAGLVFAWGRHDCATWAFDVRRRLTGHDAASEWRGRYGSAAGARRTLRRLGCGSVADLACRVMGDPLPSPLLAQRGDIVLAEDALGVCDGPGGVFVAVAGLVRRDLISIERAWRV